MAYARKKRWAMNEELEVIKTSMSNTTDLEDIYMNPVVQGILGAILPGVKDFADAAVVKGVKLFQEKKLKELFECVMADHSITLEDVKNVTVIMEFANMINVTNYLSKNGKIKYLGSLMRNSISDVRAGNVDEFEERMNKIVMMSEREIMLLETLFKCEVESGEVDCHAENPLKEFNVKEAWKLFKEKCADDLGMNVTDTTAAMFSIMRTGFCIGEWSAGISNPGTVMFYTTPEYHKFREKTCDMLC